MVDLIHNALPPNSKKKIIFIKPQDSVKECINMMIALDIGALVVMENKKLLGIVSERDIVRSCFNKNLPIETTKVKEVMHREVTILNSNDAVEMAMKAMTVTKRRHILIQNELNEIVAILSIGDVLFHLLEDKARVIEHLEKYIYT